MNRKLVSSWDQQIVLSQAISTGHYRGTQSPQKVRNPVDLKSGEREF